MKRLFLLLTIAITSTYAFAQLTPQKSGKYWGYVDDENEFVVEAKYSAVGHFNGDYAWVNIGGKAKAPECPQGGKWGVINSDGEIVCPVEYDFIDMCNDNFVAINVGGTFMDTLVYGGKWGMYDLKKRKVVIEPKYDAISRTLEDNIAWGGACKSSVVKGVKIYDNGSKKERVLVFNADLRSNCTESYYSTGDSKISWGMISVEGAPLTDISFNKPEEFINGLANVSNGALMGKINMAGELVIPCEYISMTDCFDNGLFWAKNTSGNVLYSNTGKKITNDTYPVVTPFYGNVAFVAQRDSVYALLNSEGKRLTDYIFDKVHSFYNDLATIRYKKTNSVNIINTKGEAILKGNYKELPNKFGSNSSMVCSDEDKNKISWGKTEDGNIVWFDSCGNILEKGKKRFFEISDKIPSNIWDF